MSQKLSLSSSAVSMVMLLAGCSANGGHSTAKTTQPTQPAGTATTPGTPWDNGSMGQTGGPVTMACNLDTSSAAKALYATDATKGLATGAYPGDDKCILPPDSSLGMSFHYGPATYDDPNEVAKYVITPGQEITDCSLFPSTNAAAVYFREYHSRMRPGSHHMLLYLTPLMPGETPTTSDGPVDCNMMATKQATQQRNLFGAQQAVWDGDITAFAAPENKGVAVMVGAQQQVVMQAHFINATTNAMLREVWANILFVDKSQVTELGDPIFFIAGVGMNIPMGQTQVLTGTATVPMDAASDFRLLIATGHYHAHTARFTAYKTVNGVKDLLFEDYGQSTFKAPYTEVAPEPGTYYFSSTGKNPVPDQANHVAGGYSGTLYMKPGDTIDWECEINNNDVSSTSMPPYNAAAITFANAVYSGEMCNMFGLYVPSLAPDTGCSWKGGQSTAFTNGKSMCP